MVPRIASLLSVRAWWHSIRPTTECGEWLMILYLPPPNVKKPPDPHASVQHGVTSDIIETKE